MRLVNASLRARPNVAVPLAPHIAPLAETARQSNRGALGIDEIVSSLTKNGA